MPSLAFVGGKLEMNLLIVVSNVREKKERKKERKKKKRKRRSLLLVLAFLSLPNRKETGERLSLPKAIETTTAPLRIAKFSTRRFLSLLALQKGEVFFLYFI